MHTRSNKKPKTMPETESTDKAADAPVCNYTPDSILSSQGCTARTLSISDQHATILLTHVPHQSNIHHEKTIETKDQEPPIQSILKVLTVPYHRSILSLNAVTVTEENPTPSLEVDPNDPAATLASTHILQYLNGYDFTKTSDSGAEYSFHNASPTDIHHTLHMRTLTDPLTLELPPTSFKVELIAPATTRQISRAMPFPSTLLLRETYEMYQTFTQPYIQKVIDSGSLNWIHNILNGTKEAERQLYNDSFLLNIDTKWRSHPDPFTVPKETWKTYTQAIRDLYVLAIVRDESLCTLRDLTENHVPLLKQIEKIGCEVIQNVYHVEKDQLRVFIHYQPQFYRLHVHFTMLGNEFGCSVEKAHLLTDVIQNLELDGGYYRKRVVCYKLTLKDAKSRGLLSEAKPPCEAV